MILEKNIKKDLNLELSKALLEKANLWGRVNIIVEENEITIKKVSGDITNPEQMVGLAKGIFDKDSVSLQRNLRKEWKL